MELLVSEKRRLARGDEQRGSRALYTHLACFGKEAIFLIAMRLCCIEYVGRFFLKEKRLGICFIWLIFRIDLLCSQHTGLRHSASPEASQTGSHQRTAQSHLAVRAICCADVPASSLRATPPS